MTPDCYRSLGLGETDEGIVMFDADGDLMAAIQALSKKLAELKHELQQQQVLINQYKSQLSQQ